MSHPIPDSTEDRRSQKAAEIWHQYREAVDNDDEAAYQAAWDQAEAWVRQYYPRAETFSLDTLVNGAAGISITMHLSRDPGEAPTITKTGADEYRHLVWRANENPWDTWSRRDIRLDDPKRSEQ